MFFGIKYDAKIYTFTQYVWVHQKCKSSNFRGNKGHIKQHLKYESKSIMSDLRNYSHDEQIYTNEGIRAGNIIFSDKESNELSNVNSTILFYTISLLI